MTLDSLGNTSFASPKTNRGYTGHEHIEGTKFINMNARLYDPTIARFMSADTIIQDPYDTQSYNRYSYVRNNPLKYTDPSGHSWLSNLWHHIKNIVKTIVTIIVVAAVTIYTAGVADFIGLGSIGTGVLVGAAAGFTGGFVGTLVNGGGLGGALKAGLSGALVGAVSGGLAAGVAEFTGSLFDMGSKLGHSVSFFHAEGHFGVAAFKAVAHGVTRAFIAKAQGQSMRAGFWSGFVSSAFSVGSRGYGGVAGRTFIMATVGGTVSRLTGGKFANGAVSAAFVHMFNAENIVQKIGKYFIGKPEAHNGGKTHVHWGKSSNKRLNAVNVDGTVRHGNNPPNKVKSFINKTFKEFKIPGLMLLVPESVMQDMYINQATCGAYSCQKVY